MWLRSRRRAALPATGAAHRRDSGRPVSSAPPSPATRPGSRPGSGRAGVRCRFTPSCSQFAARGRGARRLVAGNLRVASAVAALRAVDRQRERAIRRRLAGSNPDVERGDFVRRALRPAPRAGLLSAVLLLAGLFCSQGDSTPRRRSGRRVGFTLTDSQPRRDHRSRRAGLSGGDAPELRAGDRLLEIGGQPMRDEIDYDRAALGFRRDEPVLMVVDRAGQRLELMLRRRACRCSWLELVLDLLVALAYIALGARRDRPGPPGRPRPPALRSTRWRWRSSSCCPREPVNLVGDRAAGRRSLSTCSPACRWAPKIHLSALLFRSARTGSSSALDRAAASTPSAPASSLVTAMRCFVERTGGRCPGARARRSSFSRPRTAGLGGDARAGILGERFLHHPRREGRQQAGLVLLGAPALDVVVFSSPAAAPRTVHRLRCRRALWTLVLLAFRWRSSSPSSATTSSTSSWCIRKSLLYGALTSSLVLVFYAALGAGGGALRALPRGRARVGLGGLGGDARARAALQSDAQAPAGRDRSAALSGERGVSPARPRPGRGAAVARQAAAHGRVPLRRALPHRSVCGRRRSGSRRRRWAS